MDKSHQILEDVGVAWKPSKSGTPHQLQEKQEVLHHAADRHHGADLILELELSVAALQSKKQLMLEAVNKTATTTRTLHGRIP